MSDFHDKRFPGESREYRAARDALLRAEIALRQQHTSVVSLRSTLPLGGKLKQNYVFNEATGSGSKTRRVKFSELFAKGKPSLVIYSFMFAPDADLPCPLCSSILDGLDGQAHHITDRINFVVIAKAPPDKIRDWAGARGWTKLRLLSSLDNSYNTDYFAESEDGAQWPALNVFQKSSEGIFHFYSAEQLYSPTDEGQQSRHVDLLWPIWNTFDLTPEGRGTDWNPKHANE